MATILINGAKREVHAPSDTPLLYVLKNDLEQLATSSTAPAPAQ